MVAGPLAHVLLLTAWDLVAEAASGGPLLPARWSRSPCPGSAVLFLLHPARLMPPVPARHGVSAGVRAACQVALTLPCQSGYAYAPVAQGSRFAEVSATGFARLGGAISTPSPPRQDVARAGRRRRRESRCPRRRAQRCHRKLSRMSRPDARGPALARWPCCWPPGCEPSQSMSKSYAAPRRQRMSVCAAAARWTLRGYVGRKAGRGQHQGWRNEQVCRMFSGLPCKMGGTRWQADCGASVGLGRQGPWHKAGFCTAADIPKLYTLCRPSTAATAPLWITTTRGEHGVLWAWSTHVSGHYARLPAAGGGAPILPPGQSRHASSSHWC